MEKRINQKLAYLNNMADKYNKLNEKTHNKYDWREDALNIEINALKNILDDITGEWNEAYEEDLKESEYIE